ncbi:hypothetical protein [Marinobacter adhaerens]|jgi:hypothetical protein|uniref:hypothetical protein n=1 Tax=Marinobacter adhaerens TaxID=1033846 RepID=UPI003BAD3BA1
MVGLFEAFSKVLRVSAEFFSLAGLLLLLYYLSSVVDFFPPSLSFGDAVKLVLLCFLAATHYFLIVLFALLVGAFFCVPGLYLASRAFKDRRSFFVRCFDLVASTDLQIFYCLSAVLVPISYYFLHSQLIPEFAITVTASTAGFLFLIVFVGEASGKTAVFDVDGRLVGAGFFAKFEHEYSDPGVLKLSGLILVTLFFVSPVGYLGSFEKFSKLVMESAGVAQVDTSLYVDSHYCPMLRELRFSVSEELIGEFCLVSGVNILFQGIGTETLLEYSEESPKLPIPSESVVQINE